MSKKYFAPRNIKTNYSRPPTTTAPQSPASTSTPRSVEAPCDVVRFFLISGEVIDLVPGSIEETSEMWANKLCIALCGCRPGGNHIAIPIDRVNYVEGITHACNQ